MEYLTLGGLIAVGKTFGILMVESPLDFVAITHDDHAVILFIPRSFGLAEKGRALGECIHRVTSNGKVSAA